MPHKPRDLETYEDTHPPAPNQRDAKKEPSTYEKIMRERELAKANKTPMPSKARSIGLAIEAFLTKEGFPVTVKPPQGIAAHHLNIDGEEIKVLSIQNTIKVSGSIGTDTIYIISSAENMGQDTINSRVCAWICKRISMRP